MGYYKKSATKKYSGQVLAIVLVVLFVGVIIALALLARTMSDERQTVEERRSAEALQAADTILNSVKAVDFDDLMAWLNDPSSDEGYSNVCLDGQGDYSFPTTGCVLTGMDELEVFTDRFGLQSFYSAIEESLLGTESSCKFENAESVGEAVKLVMKPFGEEDLLEIDKDSVFAFVYGASNTGPCSVRLSALPIQRDLPSGVVYTAIYATQTGGVISDYKPYEFSDIVGQCLDNNCAGGSGDWVGWYTDPATPFGEFQEHNIPNIKSFNGINYFLHEIRVRPVGTDIFLRRGGDCPKEELLWAETNVTCDDQYRALHFVLSGQEWAPALFDYVLFNGSGTLRYTPQ